ncbi:MAG: hypothetical protein OJJ21_21835 [Ferrovibrio sp.]|uniref:hypothetical protein n=1 Tax=Ferrovibrio sp. TaxID=1917215 RepID=UPI00263743C9|nr:hypothetical protein [Ferrovibrio sp.]MCW0236254.1 hypothetical protein [Ferrovibrio sp.]
MDRTVLSPVCALVLAGLLSACGPPLGWQKPGVTLAEAQTDSRDCANLARDQAFRESFFGSPYFYGGYGTWPSRFGPYPGPYGYHGYDSFMWRSQRESDLQNFCLRARGYHLAPIAQQ